MADNDTTRFTVGVKNLSERPVVAPDGGLTHQVVFYVQADGEQLSFEVDGGVVRGDVLSRCLDLQEKGYVVVDMPSHWEPDFANDNWHHEVVEAALDRAKSESA
jgi:hypothetical protein